MNAHWTEVGSDSAIASRSCRGAGQFSFSFCNAKAVLDITGSPAGPCAGKYDQIYTWAEKPSSGSVWMSHTETEQITISDSSYSVTKTITGECGTDKKIIELRLFPHSCDSGNAGDKNSAFHSVHINLFLGRNALGQSDGYLLLDSETLATASVYTPAALVAAPATGTEVIRDAANAPRQMRASQGLADIVPLASPAVGYEVRFYHNDQIGTQDPTTGIYAVTGTPFVTHRIENPDGTTPVTVQRLRSTELRGSITKVQDFSFNPTTNQWALTEGGGSRTETRAIATNGADTITTVSITDAAGTLVAKSILTDTAFPWGTERTKEVVYPSLLAPVSSLLQTSYTYYTDSAADGVNYRHLKSKQTPTGYWETYAYDNLGRLTKTVSQVQNAAFGSADSASRVVTYTYDTIPDADGDQVAEDRRTTVETLLGTETSRRYEINYSSLDVVDGRNIAKKSDLRCTVAGAAWDAATNLVTITRRVKDGLLADRPISELRPDGTLTTTAYTPTATTLTTVTMTGAPSTDGLSVIDGIKTITTEGPSARLVSRLTYDIASGLLLSSETVSATDEFGRPTRIDYADGTFITRSYACCGLDSETDRQGITTSYIYDALRRVTDVTRAGITTHTTYDPEGRVLTVSRIGSDTTTLVQQTNTYDLAGRPLTAQDALNRPTTYSQTFDASGQTVKTTTTPAGTRIETYAKDGSLLSVSGTAAAPLAYEYGVDASGVFTKEIRLGSSAETTEWTKTYTDFAGRSYKTLYADNATQQNVYNAKGQLAQTIDPDGVTTLYAYNARGEQEIAALDLDRNGAIDFTGTDRIVKTTTQFTTAHGTTVRQTTTAVTATDGDAALQTVALTEASTDGAHTWQTVDGLTTTTDVTYPGSGIRQETTTTPDLVQSIRQYVNDRLTTNTVLQPTLGTLGSATYAYDTHGRLQSTTDARTGTTTYTYYNDDQVHTVTTPDPDPTKTGAGYDPQTTSYVYDNAGRLQTTTLPDTTTVTQEYYPTGQLKKTTGSRTYPQAYTYDAQGRVKTLTTWQDYAGQTGAATTSWNYDSARGWLLNKRYNDATGPSYAYYSSGRLHTRTWARLVNSAALVTTYTYNNAGDLSGIDYSDTTPDVALTYDRRGRAATTTDAVGTLTRSYHASGQLQNETYGATGLLANLAVNRTFDTLDRLESVSALSASSAVNSSSFGYDAASRLQTVDVGGAPSPRITYGYLPNSSLVQTLTYTQGAATRLTTTKLYDKLNRLQSISSAPSAASLVQSVYLFNQANQRTRLTREDNAYWNYGYDPLGQVTSGQKRLADGTGALGDDFAYTYDDIGNRKTATTNGQLSTYTPTLLNQYAQRTIPGSLDVSGTAAADATVAVLFPATGGTITPTIRQGETFFTQLPVNNASTAQYPAVKISGVKNNVGTNGEDAVTEITKSAFVAKTPEVFIHDADGNLTTDAKWTYTWDAENRLTAMETTAAAITAGVPKQRLEFTYDAQGRRIAKKAYSWNPTPGFWMLASDLRFVYDGWNLVAEFNVQGSTFNVQRSYTWGLDLSGSFQGAGGVGGLLAITDVGGVPAPRTYATTYDGNGNVIGLINAADGTLAAEYEYDPFGNTIKATGSAANAQPFGFSTKYTDTETGLCYYGFRYYSPATGRWPNRDPIKDPGFELTQTDFSQSNSLVSDSSQTVNDADGDVTSSVAARPNSENQHQTRPLHYEWNRYLFVFNNAIQLTDAHGLDITLETGNNKGLLHILNDVFHQNICGGCGDTKVCFSFSVVGVQKPQFSKKWLGWDSPVTGAILRGVIYAPKPVSGATISARHVTTPEQDYRWLMYMLTRVGTQDAYSVARHNCRAFTQWEFRDAPLHW
jgi:RHS repeat-associated protein